VRCLLLLLQLESLVHLLEVTGPTLDKTTSLLSTVRRILPVDKSNVMGKVTLFTKPKGTIGLQPDSIILGQKLHPQSPFNNGAPPAPLPPPVPAFPRTLPPLGTTTSGPSKTTTGSSVANTDSSMSTGADTGNSGTNIRAGTAPSISNTGSSMRTGVAGGTHGGIHAPIKASNGRSL
jgi:hypothetical protein